MQSELEKYIGPKVVYCGKYILGVERLADMREEMEKLYRDHFYETETRYLDEELDPDYEYALLAESRGRALFFTVRNTEDDHRLVGNATFFIGPCIHMKSKVQASEDTFYLAPAHRDQGLATMILRFIKESLTTYGADYLWMTDKSPSGGKSLSTLFETNGLTPVYVGYLAKLPKE